MPIAFSCKPKKKPTTLNSDGTTNTTDARWNEPSAPSSPQPPSMQKKTDRWSTNNYTALGALSVETGTPNIQAYATSVAPNSADKVPTDAQADTERAATIQGKSQRKSRVQQQQSVPNDPPVPILTTTNTPRKKSMAASMALPAPYNAESRTNLPIKIWSPTKSSHNITGMNIFKKISSKINLYPKREEGEPPLVEAWKETEQHSPSFAVPQNYQQGPIIIHPSDDFEGGGRIDLYHRKFSDSLGRKRLSRKKLGAPKPALLYTLSQQEMEMLTQKRRSRASSPAVLKKDSNSKDLPMITWVPPKANDDEEEAKKRRKSRTRSRVLASKETVKTDNTGDAESYRNSGALAIPPLTRKSNERRSDGSKVYSYPSFSGRTSADCEYIEIMGAKQPRAQTALTRAVFGHAEHAQCINDVDKATGGPHNYRQDLELETIYGMRVKKFWDRYQLKGTPYLDHLRTDPEYELMPPHIRTKLKRLHAENEHLCQHLYGIKSDDNYNCQRIDNRLPHGFGKSINVQAGIRAKTWRLLTEKNYKLFLRILRVAPLCGDQQTMALQMFARLKCQLYLSQQPATHKRFKRRLEHYERCLNDPNYDRNGPSWWRTLSKTEIRILNELLQAQADDDDEQFCELMRQFNLKFERYHLQEALDMCNSGRGAASVGEVMDPLELLYYLRMTQPVRDAPYTMRTFFFVAIVIHTPQYQIEDVRETLKTCFNWRDIKRAKSEEFKEAKKHPEKSGHMYQRLRDIRDALKIYPSAYAEVDIKWLTHNSKYAAEFTAPGPYNVKENVRQFNIWAANKRYMITKLPDFGRLPMFQRYYMKALEKFRPPECVFLATH